MKKNITQYYPPYLKKKIPIFTNSHIKKNSIY